MNILFICTWGAADGLTSATVIPHVKILGSLPKVSRIILITLERERGFKKFTDIHKTTHVPISSIYSSNNFINSLVEFLLTPFKIGKISKGYAINHIICRGAPAGNYGVIMKAFAKIPFDVESFEPHSKYMIESEVWSKFDPRYILQRYFEMLQIKMARTLLPVSHNYENYLKMLGVAPERIKMIPCTIDPEIYQFNHEKREEKRKELGILSTDVVGIYVGKFGSIYYLEPAFEMFRSAKNVLGSKFYLIILSPFPSEIIQNYLLTHGLSREEVYVKNVPYSDVPVFLSASDYAFNTVVPSASRKFCSPIKDGEYWANGLPILISNGIGDDSELVINEHSGAIVDYHNEESRLRGIAEVLSLIKNDGYRFAIKSRMIRYRDMEIDQRIYGELYG